MDTSAPTPPIFGGDGITPTTRLPGARAPASLASSAFVAVPILIVPSATPATAPGAVVSYIFEICSFSFVIRLSLLLINPFIP